MNEVILMVLSGPHVGAQVALLEQPLVLGSSDQADVVLNDPHVAAKHCEIKVAGKSGASVKALEGSFYIDGKKAGETAPLSTGQVLTLGSTHLAVGLSGTAWPTLRLPDIREIQTPGQLEPAAVTKPKKKGLIPSWAIAAGMITMLSIAVGAFIWQSAVSARPGKFLPGNEMQFDQTAPDSGIKYEAAFLESVGKRLPNVTADFSTRNGVRTMFLWGRNLEELSRARAMINKIGYPAPIEIVNLSALETSLHALAAMFGYPLEAKCAAGGIVTWTGYVPSEADWKIFEGRFATDAPLLRKNIVNVTYGTVLRQRIDKILVDNGIRSGVTVEAGKRSVDLSGAVPGLVLPKIQKDLAALGNEHVYIRNDLKTDDSSPLPSQLLGSPIIGVFVGEMAWIALANGQRLFIGARLPGGFTLQQIQRDTIQLQGPSGVFEIPVHIKSGSEASP